jgi:hypothetical protein
MSLLVSALALSLATAISPVTVEVTTRGGHREALPIADADATVLRVCAHEDGVADVCAPVVVDSSGAHAALDVDHRAVRFSLVRTRFDARSAAPVAVAIGCGAATVLAATGALAATNVVLSGATANDGVSTATATSSADAFTPIAGALWIAAGVGAVGTAVATVAAISATTQASAE